MTDYDSSEQNITIITLDYTGHGPLRVSGFADIPLHYELSTTAEFSMVAAMNNISDRDTGLWLKPDLEKEQWQQGPPTTIQLSLRSLRSTVRVPPTSGRRRAAIHGVQQPHTSYTITLEDTFRKQISGHREDEEFRALSSELPSRQRCLADLQATHEHIAAITVFAHDASNILQP
ncbi:hypothetical protein AbraIFM66951_000950 [Aspergillus brasiliensis]|uniref:Uncharacterized protein n=1 Tax=Aspergillus brasiliensis TaxID=319629 RepID=A0A9W5YJU9_9EURO|nr:hypothetical protein AbraCBS73388_000961 [Aspergillus brasiliensis]GKZ42242.1 hypothetical protein AbraIFM66951_000950 [Aspergillus brasiliensis]